MKKKIMSILLVISFLFVFGCGDSKVIKVPGNTTTGYKYVEFDTYGLFNQNDKKNPKIRYRLIIGNVVWSVILVETIIAPIYFLGFSLYEPVGLKTGKEVAGEI